MSAQPSTEAPPQVTLDRSGEPWVGTFPGLGTVQVWADGRVEASPTVGPDTADATADEESIDRRRRALVHGWGEPLALGRLGFHVAHCSAVVPPDTEQCLLVSGDAHDFGIVTLGLAARGWRVLADLLTPLALDEPSIVAHPRPGPVLGSARRAARHGIDTTAVRADTDTVAVAVARAEAPHPVGALVTSRIRRPHDPLLERVRGHRRIEAAGSLFIDGALATDPAPGTATPATVMARTMQVAALAMAAVHVDPAEPAPAIDALVAWWGTR